MLKDITIGQFFPGNSVLHRMDPRAKILLTVIYITALFMARNFIAFLLMALFSLVLIALSKISPKQILKGLKPLIFIIALTSVLNIFYNSNGNVVFTFPIFSWTVTVTDTGILTALFIIVRLVLLIITTSLLTYTTSPMLLTDGLEKLLSPLKLIKIPVHEFSMMMTIALRFIPTLVEETDKIISAQKSRGANFDDGGLIKRAKSLIPILVPLFVSAFRRAEELATAMECRCYSGGRGRTRLKLYRLSAVDYVSFAVLAVLFAGVIVFNIIGFGFNL